MTEPILQTVGLSIRFGGVEAVRGVNLCLAERELRCLIGPNGAGKSTLFKLLTGQLQPTAGRILFHGEDITGDHTHAIARRGIGIKTQVPNLFDSLTVRDHLWLAARRTNSRPRADAITDEIIERVGLGAIAGGMVGRLSHGLRQWAAGRFTPEAVAYAAKENIQLIDGASLLEKLAALVPEKALALLKFATTGDFLTPTCPRCSVKMIARTVTVMHQGAVLVEDTMDQILKNSAVRDIYLGKHGGA